MEYKGIIFDLDGTIIDTVLDLHDSLNAILEKNGLIFSGINTKANLVEIIELSNHPHFIASQFHPEFKSRPTKPHPLFLSFIEAANKMK